MSYKPINGNIVVRRDEKKELTKNGVVVRTEASKIEPTVGTVLASDAPEKCNAGDRILFGHHAGIPFDEDDPHLLVMHSGEVLLKYDIA